MSEPEFRICEVCNQQYNFYEWCNSCNAKRFQENFKNWTSGNDNINKFIQNIQLSANSWRKALEWIPYDRFYDINYIAKGGFGKVYKAKWIDGNINYWDDKNRNWNRVGSTFVALKSLNNSKNVTSEFINEITSHSKLISDTNSPLIRFYGITQDPETKNYMMVLGYAKHGSLRNYLDSNKSFNDYSWKDRVEDLRNIALGLNAIHGENLIHRDLHIGNILKPGATQITDMGLCQPADYNTLENTKKSIFGVLPYVAPEVLRGQNYTKASDIYSFGIIMYEVCSGLPPYYDMSHNENLAMKICYGLRPTFNIKAPQLIVNLIKRCLDANPLNRPAAEELFQILDTWYLKFNDQIELQEQIEEADKINKNLQNSNSSTRLETHSEAIYTSRLLNFNNLPESENSNDYYDEQSDNIISTKFSESLKISQWKISDGA